MTKLTLQEAKKLLEKFEKDFKGIDNEVRQLIEASATVAREEAQYQCFKIVQKNVKTARDNQVKAAGNILMSMLDSNLENEYYFGVFGEVRNHEFVENFKEKLSSNSQEND